MAMRSRRHRRLLALLTVVSRVLTGVLLYLSSHLPLFDASPRTVLPPSDFPSLASSLLRWDAFYFRAIAEHGYVYEQQWAFFPGMPLLLRALALLPTVLQPLAPAAAASASVHTLYELTALHFPRAPAFAYLAALLSLLPLSPATLYFAEPLFTLFSYKGMLACARKSHFTASIFFFLAATIRSNGILLAIYVPWDILVDPFLRTRNLRHLLPSTVLRAGLHALAPLLPSLIHQARAYRAFCLPPPGLAAPEWCGRALPSIYTHAQSTYWRVGFLTYWTPAQAPNILLALPVLALLLWWSATTLHTQITALVRPPQSGAPKDLPHAPSLIPHALHALVLALTLLLAAHTQIALRLAPALPATAWAGAALLAAQPPPSGSVHWGPDVRGGKTKAHAWRARLGRAWVGWSVVWGATSVVLWGAFLPPA